MLFLPPLALLLLKDKVLIMKSKRKGFTLIEVLVALAVLSLGLLGLAALQTRGQQFTQEAYFVTQATVLANQIMDRMRLNVNFARTNFSGGTGGYVASTSPSSTNCATAACDATSTRNYDLFIWYNALATNLPNGTGTITGATVNGRVRYTVTITWSPTELMRDDPDATDAVRVRSWVLDL
jgi:type IV pilus assembly protein PilV